MSRDRFHIKHSVYEWAALETIARKHGYPNFRAYANVHLHKIIDNISETESGICMCDVKPLFIDKPEHISKELKILSEKHCISPGHLITKFIINPALKNYYDEHGY